MSKLITIQNPLNLVSLDNEAVASSLDIASEFGKLHKHILDKIEKLIVDLSEIDSAENSAQYKTLNIVFEHSTYKDSSGKSNRMYYLSEDAFNLLIMGFTGKKAMLKKLQFASCYSIVKNWIKDRKSCKLEFKHMNEELKSARETSGKDTKFFHYCNEADMINRCVLGLTAKQYCELNKVDRGLLRNSLSHTQLELIDKLEKYNTALIISCLTLEQRKPMIATYHAQLMRKLLN